MAASDESVPGAKCNSAQLHFGPLLSEARDLLYHQGSHVRGASEGYPPCPGCDLEARIDAALVAHDYSPRITWRKHLKRFFLALTPARRVATSGSRRDGG